MTKLGFQTRPHQPTGWVKASDLKVGMQGTDCNGTVSIITKVSKRGGNAVRVWYSSSEGGYSQIFCNWVELKVS